jgi:hypothetical protein
MIERLYPRYTAKFLGMLVHQEQTYEITSLDLSRKGCRLENTFHAVPGMPVDILLYPPGKKMPLLMLGAMVRWSAPQGIGVEFQPLPLHHQDHLDLVIRELELRIG